MNATTFTCLSALIIAVALWPKEANEILAAAGAVLMIKYLNLQLLVRSWLIYRRLKADFRQFGIEIPPFKFVPLQDRSR